jgi:hypothetical protein
VSKESEGTYPDFTVQLVDDVLVLTFAVDSRQQIAIAAGNALLVFGLTSE